MPDYFKINPNEMKIVRREQYICADNLVVQATTENPVECGTTAPRLKIKFFLDALRYLDTNADPAADMLYRIGKYFEVEHNGTFQVLTERGYVWFKYECTQNDGTGKFLFKFTANENEWATLYISSVVFEDSFYNPAMGWMNPNNPDNILSEIQVQKLPGVRRMDLTYCRVTMRNSVPVTAPVTPPKDLNTYYQCYADDFLEIGYWKATAALNRMFIIPRGIHTIKPTIQIDEQNYEIHGSYDYELPVAQAPITATLVAATSLPVEERRPDLVPITFDNAPFNLKTIHSNANPAIEPIGIPDALGFSILINANNATKGKVFWDAIDGYTYGLAWEGATYNVNTANFAADIGFVYLGRNQTGKSPVPEDDL